MKNIFILFVLFVSLFFAGNFALACSPVPDYTYPTVQSVLSEGGIVTLGKTLAGGDVVAVEKIQSSSLTSSNYFLAQIPGHSCGDRFADYFKGEYIITVSSKDIVMVSNSSLDSEFSFYFNSIAEAREKYNEFVNYNIDPIFTNYIPAGYTLRSGMKNNDVRTLQMALNDILSENLSIDGDYGLGTVAAVRRFQVQNDLFADGIAGKNTQLALANLSSIEKSIPQVDLLDDLGRTIKSECQVVSLCNGHIECMNADIDVSNIVGTCEYKASYACYEKAGNICEVQSTGTCGWTQTDTLQMCIKDLDSNN